MSELKRTYRRLRKRFDNPEVSFARALVQRMTSAPPDVLHLGASESVYIDANDSDWRNLPTMTADLLAPTTVHSIAQGGYHPALYTRFVRIAAAASAARPLLLVGIGARLGDDAWHEHPEYGYQRSMRALDRIGVGKPAARYRAFVRSARESEFGEYDKRPFDSMIGERSVGEFRRMLKDNHDVHDPERVRTIYAYHHGGRSPLSARYLAETTELGTLTRELGYPVVLYEFPVCVDRAAEVLGEEVREHIIARGRSAIDAFLRGYGPAPLVEALTSYRPDEFLDPDDGTEHLNEKGRLRLATDLAAAIRHRLDQPQEP